jgi:hypothetical protein
VFRGELTPDECWDLIAHLPPDSALMAALADDPDTPVSDGPAGPRWQEFSPEVRVLADMYDMLGVLVRQVASIGGKPPKIDPYPRPGDARRRALEAARREQARAEWAELCRRLGIR